MKINEKCIKLICGAGNEDIKEVEKLSYIFASAGFNMIDLCAKKNVIESAKRGIEEAGKTGLVDICVSIGLQDDIHFSKAVINNSKCISCKKCLEICPQNALFYDEVVRTDEKKCIGCGACIKICENDAIRQEHKYKTPVEMLLPILPKMPDCVEFHCSSSDEKLITDSLNRVKSVYDGIISICINRENFGNEKLTGLLKKMCENDEKIIIQADGKAMTGGKDDLKSSLQSVAFADVIRSSGINSYMILSGGCNAKTSFLAKMLEVNINGVALGSYARKAVKEYTSAEDFWDNDIVQTFAINKACEIYDELSAYL